MAWRDNLLPASLNGLEFLYEEVSNTVGRRGVVHEFPGRDIPFAQDLGRKARRYKVRAFLIGENYAATREDLIGILESGEELDFVHPYRGSFAVRLIGDATVTETDKQGRTVRFDFTLVESGLAFPTLQLDTPARVTILAADALEKLDGTKFNLLNAIGAVLKSVANGLNKASSKVRKVNGKISGALNLVDNISGQLDAFNDSINDLLSTPDRIVNEITQLLRATLDLLDTFTELPTLPGVRVEVPNFVAITLDALEEFTGFITEGDNIPTPTAQSEQEEATHAAITNAVNVGGLIVCTDELAQLELVSADQAKSVVNSLGAKFDVALNLGLEPEIVEALSALKAGMIEHFTTAAQELPTVRVTELNYSEPALVMAHRLYGSDTLEQDLIDRNSLRHPVFTPSGVGLEVLSGE